MKVADALTDLGIHVLEPDWSRGSKHVRRAVIMAFEQATDEAEMAFLRLRKKCESPIECVGLAAVLALFPDATAMESKGGLKSAGWRRAIIPQMWYHRRRLDVAIVDRATKTVFSLECDGKDYHWNRSADSERDVELWGWGCLCFHVSGSALCRDPIAAVAPLKQKVIEHGRAAMVQTLRS